MLHVKKTEVYYSCRVRYYPDGYWEETVCSQPVFRDGGWEPSEGRYVPDGGGKGTTRKRAENGKGDTLRAVRRASANIRRLTHCADMAYFVTLTLDPQRIDRYDPDVIVRKMGQWCSDRVKRDGLCYVLVAEHHKDGAIHFHGFFNGALEVVDSGTIRRPGRKRPVKPRSERQREQMLAEGGQVVYNIPAWRLGFSTAIELYGDKDSAISYVCKYLTKELRTGGKIGGRWYYHGGKFEEPIVNLHNGLTTQDIVFEPIDGYYMFDVPEAGLKFGIRRGYDAAAANGGKVRDSGRAGGAAR